MKIKLIEINDYKKLRNVLIEPGERSVVLIGGKNKQGKSTLLGAMSAALGGKKEVPEEPIRHGVEKASIRIVFDDDGGDLIVRRKFTKKSTSIEVTSDGGTIKAPQKMLDRLVGARFIDPMKFSRLPKKEQREVMLGCVELGIDLDENIADEKKAYEERRDLNRDIKKLEAKVDDIPKKPIEGEDPSLLQAQLDEFTEKESKARLADRDISQLREQVKRATQRKLDAQAELKTARENLQVASKYLEETLARVEPEIVLLQAVADDEPAYEEVEAARAKMAEFIQNGDALSKYRVWEEECRELAELKETSQAKSMEIDAYKDLRTEALAKAKMPIAGLTFDDEGLRLSGAPFYDASGAEKLMASIAIALALQPDLQDVWVEEGALLDEDSLVLLEEFADEKNVRIWIERVGEGDDEAIIMVDGAVKS